MATERVERRLAAILAVDVAGYSRLMSTDEEWTHERLKAHFRQLIEPKIHEHRGRIVKNTGDGLLAEFSSAVNAVRCAAEMQRAMIDRNAEIAEDRQIKFRVGINLGDVIVEEDDVYGDGVNIAARLEALAEPGGICITRSVHEQIQDKIRYRFEDLGEQSVKNISRPVRAYGMSATEVASLPPVPSLAEVSKSITASTAPRLSIVVLPFANLSNDPEQEYFSDGITDDLTTDLSRISGSFVIARNTAFTYKDKSVDVKQIGRELGVRYVLEGSVRRVGDQVRVNVQLIDAENGSHLWADRFDTDRINLAEAQDEITGRLARTLNLELVEAAGRQIEQEKALNPVARDLVMRGWADYYRPRSAASLAEAGQAFERALELHPRSIDARIGLAAALVANLLNGWSHSSQQDQARAEQLLLEALERDSNLSMAHHVLGTLRRSQNRLAEARIEFETAIALNRNHAPSFSQLGQTLMFLGDPEAGIPHVEKALRLNPRERSVADYFAALGSCHLLLGHVDQAIDLLRMARAENPRYWYVHFNLAAALGLKGDIDEAEAALTSGIELKPEVNSIAQWCANRPWAGHPRYMELAEKTLHFGLRRAGMPDE